MVATFPEHGRLARARLGLRLLDAADATGAAGRCVSAWSMGRPTRTSQEPGTHDRDDRHKRTRATEPCGFARPGLTRGADDHVTKFVYRPGAEVGEPPRGGPRAAGIIPPVAKPVVQEGSVVRVWRLRGVLDGAHEPTCYSG